MLLVAAGKAAWQMAHAAVEALGRVDSGVVVTKYGHVKGEIPGVTCCEAGHPVPDENSFAAHRKGAGPCAGPDGRGYRAVPALRRRQRIVRAAAAAGEELQDITSQLLASGADIVEMNTIRKRLSAVKGGRFAQGLCPGRGVQHRAQ